MSEPAERLPGAALLRLARAILNDAIVTDVFEPAIADLHQEWLTARDSRAGRWLARWRGYFAFWSLVCLSLIVLRHWRGRRSPMVLSRSTLMTMLGLTSAVIIWAVNGFYYLVWALAWSMESLPGNPSSAIGAWAGAAFLAGPVVIILAKRSAGGVRWTELPLGASILLVSLSVTVAALLASSVIHGAFMEIGRGGKAGIPLVLPPVILAAQSVQRGMLALIVMFLVLIVLGLRGVRGRGPTQTDGRPRMSAMQSAGLSGLVIAGLFAVDRLLSHYQEAMNVVLILLGPTTPAERAAGFEELMETSEGIVTLFGAGAMLTICLIVFGVGLWRASRRHAPTALFTWTSRAALVVALAGSIWHTTAAFAVVRDVERLVAWVETMRRTSQRRSPGSRVLGPGAGVLVMGSWIRGDGGASSDIDVLIAVDPAVALTRDLYRAWDREPLAWNGRAIDVHVTHLADPAAAPTAVWCEAAIDGVVWFERNGAVARRLGAIRRAIAEGRVVRAVAHGQPYWKGAA